MREVTFLRRLRNARFSNRSVPIALLALALVSFGLLVPRLGFYWDDWPQLLSYQRAGAGGFWAYFASDRPLSAWTHVLFSPLLGASSTAWHFFTLGLRWLTALAAWWLFHEIWPGRRWSNIVAASIFLLYPVFSQQSIPVAYHQHWLQYALFLASLAAMLQAQRRPGQFWAMTLLAIGLQALHLSITEYFWVSELLRPLLLWFVLDQIDQRRKRALLTARAWLPSLIVLIAFFYWRFFLFQPAGKDPNAPLLLQQMIQQPVGALAKLGTIAFWDTFFTLVAQWARVFSLTGEQTAQPFTLAAWGVGVASGVAAAAYFIKLHQDDPAAGRKLVQPVSLGGLALVFGILPYWMLGGSLLTDLDPYHADRFALPAMFGAALLATALIDWIGRAKAQKAALAGILIGLAVSFHLRTANEYRWLWTEQSRFFTQLSWRAPDLQPGTAIVTEKVIFPFQGNFSTGSALNLLYEQGPASNPVKTWIYALLPRLASRDPAAGPAGLQTTMRSFQFSGSTNSAVFVEQGNFHQGCLWILTPLDRDNPYLSDFLKQWLNDAYRARILAGESKAVSPGDIFDRPVDPQGKPDWCYLYEKAELAVQLEDWPAAAALAGRARELGFSPDRPPANTAREWMAFLQGYAGAGRWQDAADLSQAIYASDPKYQAMLCGLWSQFEAPSTIPIRLRLEMGCQE